MELAPEEQQHTVTLHSGQTLSVGLLTQSSRDEIRGSHGDEKDVCLLGRCTMQSGRH
jgi:hypothetical protein